MTALESQQGPAQVAQRIAAQTDKLCNLLSQRSILVPSDLAATSTTELWTTHDGEIEELRATITALTRRLNLLLEGPQGFLHEYVSVNWEHGALYALLQYNVLEKLPLDGSSRAVQDLASETNMPYDKLLRICRLISTVGILKEPMEEFFSHTAISAELATNQGFRSFIEFQLFETRVASAHLADSLQEAHHFWKGRSAFEHAYAYHNGSQTHAG